MEATSVGDWRACFESLAVQVSDGFGRRDLRRRAMAYLRSLLGPVQRKNSWQLAEHAGDATPYGFQRLLGRARWDADRLRDETQRYAIDHLLVEGDDGVLVMDETGFLKKGNKSAGVQRQYSGTAGRIENCQIGVFLALVGARGRTLIDRELYLPQSWCEDTDRLRDAGVPESVSFATKPQLACTMIKRAMDNGLHPRWVLGDEVYGNDSKTRRFLELRGQPYVLAVGSQQRLWQSFPVVKRQRVDTIAQEIPEDAWQRLTIAQGTKGPRVYDWAASTFGVPTETGLRRWLLVRRSIHQPHEYAYYFCAAPPEATAVDLAVAAGKRWSIETCFETAKQETGLDDYEVRSWTGWYRHITLSMLALAFLAAVRAHAIEPDEKNEMIWSR